MGIGMIRNGRPNAALGRSIAAAAAAVHRRITTAQATREVPSPATSPAPREPSTVVA